MRAITTSIDRNDSDILDRYSQDSDDNQFDYLLSILIKLNSYNYKMMKPVVDPLLDTSFDKRKS
jgi:hypothetical protein